MEKLLQIYLSPKNSGSFGGINRFYRSERNKVSSASKTKELLETLDVYTVHKEIRKKFPRNRVILTNLQRQLQVDLADVKKYKSENDGVRYMLVATDCFSRKCSVQPLKDKTGEQVKRGIIHGFKELGEPKKLQCDKGSEF